MSGFDHLPTIPSNTLVEAGRLRVFLEYLVLACKEALSIFTQLGDQANISKTLGNLGLISQE